MAPYAEQLAYQGLFGIFASIVFVFALLAVLWTDTVFDWLREAAMGTTRATRFRPARQRAPLPSHHLICYYCHNDLFLTVAT